MTSDKQLNNELHTQYHLFLLTTIVASILLLLLLLCAIPIATIVGSTHATTIAPTAIATTTYICAE